jgi:pimeloyl-ACP methyl ester carboxylesterase
MKPRITLIILLGLILSSLAFTDGKLSRFTTKDGVEIIGSMWMPQQEVSPGVILLHMLGHDRHDWDSFAERLLNQGYAVVSIDLRGHGESTKQDDKTLDYKKFSDADYEKMPLDVQPVIDFLRDDKRVDGDRITIIGASIGANVALQVAASDPKIKTVVLLSPGKNYHGLTTEVAMLDYGKRPVLVAASEEDQYAAGSSRDLKQLAQGDSRLLMYKGVGHGTNMLGKETDLDDQIVDWLIKYLE